MRKVLIVTGGDSDDLIADMFKNNGWEITQDMLEADLIQFGGGEDVSPFMYGEYPHKKTHSDPARDTREKTVYDQALELGIPMAGICRGGQFLHVMNGGRLYQDVDGHSGSHPANVTGFNQTIQVSSTHHQMMSMNYSDADETIVLMQATESTFKERMSMTSSSSKHLIREKYSINKQDDIEALYHSETNCLCYQPHPEYQNSSNNDCEHMYFYFINNYLFNSEDA